MLVVVAPLRAEPKHAIAMHGAPALAPDFTHFEYANPDAPKGGRITIGLEGSFDSLNPFIITGLPARGLRDAVFGDNVFESLLARGETEPFTLYGLLAKTVEVPDDRSWVEFQLDARATFSDGTPLTVDDVIFSLETLRKDGRYNHRKYYSEVVKIEKVPPRGVRMIFANGENRELPLILGLMPVLPKHRYDNGRFNKSTLEPPLGSGPYRVVSVDPGATLVFEKNPDYWAKDLPARRGFYNFDEIRIVYFRNRNSLFEAFKKGLIDFFLEDSPSRWATNYDFPAIEAGDVVRETVETGLPKPMFAFVFNTRRPIFKDIRVRRALIKLLDFTWINKSFYHGLVRRTNSYFEGSELASTGHPAEAAEKALLAPYVSGIPKAILDGTWRAPDGDGSGRDRKLLREAAKDLAAAGWRINGGAMRHAKTGAPFAFEIMVNSKLGEQVKIALEYQKNLRPLGIKATVRSVDDVQYQRRIDHFDFDMVPFTWFASLSPGNEQIHRFGSASADQPTSFNKAGIQNAGVDAMIAALLAARERGPFVSAIRALDRLLLTGAYAVPLYHIPAQWLARWKRVSRPEKSSLYGVRIQTWWATQ